MSLFLPFPPCQLAAALFHFWAPASPSISQTYLKAFHIPHTETLAFRGWHHQLWPLLQGPDKSFKKEYWSTENSQWTLKRNTKLKKLPSNCDKCSIAGDKIFLYKAAGSNTLACLFSTVFDGCAFVIHQSSYKHSGLFETGVYSSKNSHNV